MAAVEEAGESKELDGSNRRGETMKRKEKKKGSDRNS